MIAPLWLIIVLVETIRTKNRRALIESFKAFGMSLGLMSFYLFPSYLEHHYLGYQSHQNIYTQNFVPWEHLLSQPKLLEFGIPWGHLYKSIGWPLIAVAFVSTLLCIKDIRHGVSDRIRAYRLVFLGMAVAAIFLLRPASTFLWDRIPLLAFITYPQRFLGLMAFCISVCAGLLVSAIPKRSTWIAILMIAVIILFEYPLVNLNDVFDNEQSLSVKILDTTDVWGEFMPKDIPKDFIQNGSVYGLQPMIMGASGQCTQTSTSVLCTVNTKSSATIRFRQFYFPGWIARADAKIIPITKQADGTIGLYLPEPTQVVKIEFTRTPLRKFSLFLSFIFTCWYILLFSKTLYTHGRKKTIIL